MRREDILECGIPASIETSVCATYIWGFVVVSFFGLIFSYIPRDNLLEHLPLHLMYLHAGFPSLIVFFFSLHIYHCVSYILYVCVFFQMALQNGIQW